MKIRPIIINFPSSKSSASLDTIIGIIPIDDEVNHSVLVTKQRSNEETGYATPEVHCTVFLPLAFESESLCVFSIFSRFQNLKMHFIAQVPQCAAVHCCIKVKVALVVVGSTRLVLKMFDINNVLISIYINSRLVLKALMTGAV